jgi:hypothetical protein
MWSATTEGGDVWNGRWTVDLLSSLLGDSSTLCLNQRSTRRGLRRLQHLTGLLQVAQRDLYRTRYIELTAKEVHHRRRVLATLRRQHRMCTTHTLFAAWNISYLKPSLPRRKLASFGTPMPGEQLQPHQQLLSQLGVWMQYSCPKSSTKTPLCTSPARTRRAQHTKREEHRTFKYKLRKLRHFLKICR